MLIADHLEILAADALFAAVQWPAISTCGRARTRVAHRFTRPTVRRAQSGELSWACRRRLLRGARSGQSAAAQGGRHGQGSHLAIEARGAHACAKVDPARTTGGIAGPGHMRFQPQQSRISRQIQRRPHQRLPRWHSEKSGA